MITLYFFNEIKTKCYENTILNFLHKAFLKVITSAHGVKPSSKLLQRNLSKISRVCLIIYNLDASNEVLKKISAK